MTVPNTRRIARRPALPLPFHFPPQTPWSTLILIPTLATKVFRFQRKTRRRLAPCSIPRDHDGPHLRSTLWTAPNRHLIPSGVDRIGVVGGGCRVASVRPRALTPHLNHQSATNGRHESSQGDRS